MHDTRTCQSVEGAKISQITCTFTAILAKTQDGYDGWSGCMGQMDGQMDGTDEWGGWMDRADG